MLLNVHLVHDNSTLYLSIEGKTIEEFMDHKTIRSKRKEKDSFPSRKKLVLMRVREKRPGSANKKGQKKKKRKKEKNGEFKSNRRNVNFCQASRIQLHPCGTVVLSIRSGRAALRRLVTLENTICVTWKTVRLEVDS